MNQINKKDLLSINCNGELISLSTPKVMGILNITPDSFYDGGRYKDTKSILIQVETFLEQGATFIDVGAYSSRPGAAFVSEEEELKRITPVIDLILKSFPDCRISIDSFRSKVIQKCVEAGAVISNDISSGKLDPLMFETIAKLKVPYIMMHMKGNPQNMQKHTEYENLINDIYLYFSERINRANKHGIEDLILDLGFGFSKTLEQNYKVLNQLKVFKNLNYPILSGISRKSMIYKTLESTSGEALNGTTALNMVALINGTNILRVHDVKEAMECVKLFNMYSK
ncbi:MAG: dihydropteroate synthase [Flavobacteriaceae bacterium]|nr:dihydropteroate synthase [Flavobacteriaceae bacterium]|tara:strand:+ start:38481 stop:39332 length:852 start_codon:yes stop_codon:yes gene_type:complete